MTDNRAMLELVETWQRRRRDDNHYSIDERLVYSICASELAAILERPVVVGDEDVERACKAYHAKPNAPGFYPHGMEANSRADSENRMRAALESMVRGKS